MTKNEINLSLLRDAIVTTANVVKLNTTLIVGDSGKPSFMNVQRVVAVGPTVSDTVKVGSWIYIDLSRYMRAVEKTGAKIAGVGGGKYISNELHAPVFAAPGLDKVFFKITERDIEGVIQVYEDLPDDMKNTEPIEDFLEKQKALKQKPILEKA